jgi:amino acid transporter
MSNKQTRPKIARLTTQIVMVFQTIKNSGGIYFLIAFFGPFLHLFARPDQEGVLHWSWMSSFLDSLGWAIFPLFMGLGLLSFSIRLQEDDRKVLSLVSIISVTIGCFYLAYTLISISDFSNMQYYGMITIIALFSALFLYYVHRALKKPFKKEE